MSGSIEEKLAEIRKVNNKFSACLQESQDKIRKYVALESSITELRKYGETTLANHSKGTIVVDLAKKLEEKLNSKEFIAAVFSESSESSELGDTTKCIDDFKDILHSKDPELREHRVNLSTIFKNILIALTVIGPVFIAAQLAYSYSKHGRALFFGSKLKTSSEELRDSINESINNISPPDLDA